ncbi:cell wall metabolism sensor histidine kinase WalK [Aeromicrobium sp. Leaf350]|uniref:sensor histidine kinase n=1 Tax=Aeromicrobium sp. Leaf350 TaxID=2876565 RepID=UPI001E3B2364|nr:HAMP domain-containing sensor histidine kinase [Aeromicrobium sp. Leaf350]
MTTESPRVLRAPWRRATVRTRITAGVAALTIVGLVLVSLALYAVESRRIDRTVERALLQELEEFSGFAERAPSAGITGPDAVVLAFLERNAPDARESLWAFPSAGTPQFTGDVDVELQGSDRFAGTVEQLRASGGASTIDVDGTEYRLVVQPVTDGSSTAAFVVVQDVSAARSELRSLLTTYAVVALVVLAAVTAVAAALAGRLLRPLTDLRETAQAITGSSVSAQDLRTRLEVVGHDDVAELQRTFNAMLDRVEEAFAAQRRLLDDAAHELRTPLTVIRGHLDVLDPDDLEDVAATRALVTDEVDRMGRLVGDLLMLARSVRPDFVRRTPTDAAALTVGVLERARGLGDRDWRLDGTAAVHADLDGQRLTQALLQLADNAHRHTSVGDVVAIGSAVVGEHLELWVRDTGTGIDPAVADVLFDRFARAGSDDEGFGLGLSIVQAIVLAHGGTVRVDPVQVGARLTLVLPLQPGVAFTGV